MKKDIKEIVKKEFSNTNYDLSKKHREIFINKLKKELHVKKLNKRIVFSVAVSIVFLIGMYNYKFKNKKNIEKHAYTLGSLSPELAKIENYYINAISYELAKLEMNEQNKLIFDKYFFKLEELTEQYNTKSELLNIDSITDKNINELIDNLQLRLQLLLQLKKELKRIKNKKNETYKI